jgi:hypothetical protein
MWDALSILGDVILKLLSKVVALNLVISKYPKSLGALYDPGPGRFSGIFFETV